MAGNFDAYDNYSWYAGAMSRQEATDILMSTNETGVFLVRDSSTIIGDLVLCVREDNKVSHYIVNKIQEGDQVRYKIGENSFPDVPCLLNFYKLHYLDTTPLTTPVPRKLEKVKAKYDFDGSGDPDDLPFKKGEILTILSKDEEQWWTAKNSVGQKGSIPVPYVEKIDESRSLSPAGCGSSRASPNFHSSKELNKYNTPNIQRKLPAYAKVIHPRVPNAYDSTALKLEVADIIKVTNIHQSGQWEGELRGKHGFFPFTHIEFIDSENTEDHES
ncbi:adapter molecule Crk-like isoform X1 [Limulus polyphemus]|uniref:Adapter molecule Crk-like isoform X1 n=2 Tax=Limulus polyphemus TaxID=6850 RepID=A0ABM1BKY9_LIMPO|nr:adapter molecule Crk-like isoform X1 [Limulus polyphemus]XP_022252823.1 adapter molecule Crk-like isoform X1 [Limulus polyphemus]